jgi:hypothetical protein
VAKNTVMHSKDGNTILALTKASVTAGSVVLVGDQGLIGYALTDTYVASNYSAESASPPPAGLVDGQAAIELPGITRVVKLTVAGTPDVGDRVFRIASDGTYGVTATDNNFIGWWLGIGVGLAQFVPAAVTT